MCPLAPYSAVPVNPVELNLGVVTVNQRKLGVKNWSFVGIQASVCLPILVLKQISYCRLLMWQLRVNNFGCM